MISPVLLFGLIFINAVLLALLGLSALAAVRRGETPILRDLALVVSVVCAVLFVGSLDRLGIQAARAGWVPDAVREFIFGYWDYIQTAVSMIVGIWAIRFVRKVEYPLIRAERMVEILAGHIPLSISVSELELTARELEVLNVMVTGLIADREIAAALYIAPATVGTHVHNILKKAGLHNRNELLLIGGLESIQEKQGSQ